MPSDSHSEPAAAFDQALAHFQQGQLAEALALCAGILRSRPEHADANHLTGMIHARSGNPDQALTFLVIAEKQTPDNPALLANLGNVLSSLRRFDEAVGLYDRAIALLPDVAELHSFRGNALRKSGKPEAALAAYENALALNPGDAETLCSKGMVLKDLGRHDAAVRSYDAAIAQQPQMVQAHANRGAALAAANRHEEALTSLARARELAPALAFTHLHMGISEHALGHYQAAAAHYRKALAINPADANAQHNLGISLLQLKQHEQALECFDRALALDAKLSDAFVNRGVALAETGQHDEALLSYRQAISINPGSRIAHRNLSHLLLQLGQYESGWEEFEWRLAGDAHARSGRKLPQPLWLGHKPLAGKTILLHSEQGLGDCIQFCRYVPRIAALGAEVVLEVEKPLLRLLSKLDGVASIIPFSQTPPLTDFHCPLMSLPFALRKLIGAAPVAPSVISLPQNTVDEWVSRLGKKIRPRIGVVWNGNAQHKNDSNRSVPLAEFAELLSGNFDFICLQKEFREGDMEALTALPGIRRVDEFLHDFTDTAALCSALDLVITVDTSIAHLAGTLGLPVWILLPFNPDWRWLLKRSDTPWYPSARLYRTERTAGWKTVLRKVHDDLSTIR